VAHYIPTTRKVKGISHSAVSGSGSMTHAEIERRLINGIVGTGAGVTAPPNIDVNTIVVDDMNYFLSDDEVEVVLNFLHPGGSFKGCTLHEAVFAAGKWEATKVADCDFQSKSDADYFTGVIKVRLKGLPKTSPNTRRLYFVSYSETFRKLLSLTDTPHEDVQLLPPGYAPDIIDFYAGHFNQETKAWTNTPVYTELGELSIDFAISLPDELDNLSTVSMWLRIDDTNYVNCTPDKIFLDQFDPAGPRGSYFGNITITGADLPSQDGISWTLLAVSYNKDGKPNVDAGGMNTGPTVDLTINHRPDSPSFQPPDPVVIDTASCTKEYFFDEATSSLKCRLAFAYAAPGQVGFRNFDGVNRWVQTAKESASDPLDPTTGGTEDFGVEQFSGSFGETSTVEVVVAVKSRLHRFRVYATSHSQLAVAKLVKSGDQPSPFVDFDVDSLPEAPAVLDPTASVNILTEVGPGGNTVQKWTLNAGWEYATSEESYKYTKDVLISFRLGDIGDETPVGQSVVPPKKTVSDTDQRLVPGTVTNVTVLFRTRNQHGTISLAARSVQVQVGPIPLCEQVRGPNVNVEKRWTEGGQEQYRFAFAWGIPYVKGTLNDPDLHYLRADVEASDGSTQQALWSSTPQAPLVCYGPWTGSPADLENWSFTIYAVNAAGIRNPNTAVTISTAVVAAVGGAGSERAPMVTGFNVTTPGPVLTEDGLQQYKIVATWVLPTDVKQYRGLSIVREDLDSGERKDLGITPYGGGSFLYTDLVPLPSPGYLYKRYRYWGVSVDANLRANTITGSTPYKDLNIARLNSGSGQEYAPRVNPVGLSITVDSGSNELGGQIYRIRGTFPNPLTNVEQARSFSVKRFRPSVDSVWEEIASVGASREIVNYGFASPWYPVSSVAETWRVAIYSTDGSGRCNNWDQNVTPWKDVTVTPSATGGLNMGRAATGFDATEFAVSNHSFYQKESSATKMKTGTLLVGGYNPDWRAAVGVLVRNTGNGNIGFIGSFSGYEGGWFSQFWAGGLGPATAPCFIDNLGNFRLDNTGKSVKATLTLAGVTNVIVIDNTYDDKLNVYPGLVVKVPEPYQGAYTQRAGVTTNGLYVQGFFDTVGNQWNLARVTADTSGAQVYLQYRYPGLASGQKPTQVSQMNAGSTWATLYITSGYENAVADNRFGVLMGIAQGGISVWNSQGYQAMNLDCYTALMTCKWGFAVGDQYSVYRGIGDMLTAYKIYYKRADGTNGTLEVRGGLVTNAY
jgi:hypothetical protein